MTYQKTPEERFAMQIAAAVSHPVSRRKKDYQVKVTGEVEALKPISGSYPYEFEARISTGNQFNMSDFHTLYKEQFSLDDEEDTDELRDNRLESLRTKAISHLEGEFELKEKPGSFTIKPKRTVNYLPNPRQ